MFVLTIKKDSFEKLTYQFESYTEMCKFIEMSMDADIKNEYTYHIELVRESTTEGEEAQ